LLLERSFQAQFLVPMAVSLCFGLMVATVLTLLYVPALYLIVQDIVNLFKGRERQAQIRDRVTEDPSSP
jgi:HAE1 family hydrophobic/amphiphilic exporter-1